MKPTKKVWVTRDGRRIKVKDMEDAHLVDTVRMLRRWAKFKVELQVLQFLRLPEPTGDMALMAYDRELDALLERTPDDLLKQTVRTWPALLRELRRRKLETPL